CDNDGWYDSASDGPVSATLRVKGRAQTVVPAWVVVTVPRFAPGIYGVITWYDQAVSMARMASDGRLRGPRSTSFTRASYPILQPADNLSGGHGTALNNGEIAPLSYAERIKGFADRQNRKALQDMLSTLNTKAPGPQRKPGTMPKLYSGANPDPDENAPTFT